MTADGNVLALVARYPHLGAVKTRLAAAIGAAAAYTLYCAFLRDLAERLTAGPWQLHWLYTPSDDPFAAWLGPGHAVSPQCGASLNDRLLNGFRSLCQVFPRVIIMSSDSPHVPLEWIAEGFTLLASHDVVLGPCADGGYYLVGMRAPHDLFSGITMSTATVLAETLALAHRRSLSTAQLPVTFDVDDVAGLAALSDWLDRRRTDVLPRTRALLAGCPRHVTPGPHPLACLPVQLGPAVPIDPGQ